MAARSQKSSRARGGRARPGPVLGVKWQEWLCGLLGALGRPHVGADGGGAGRGHRGVNRSYTSGRVGGRFLGRTPGRSRA